MRTYIVAAGANLIPRTKLGPTKILLRKYPLSLTGLYGRRVCRVKRSESGVEKLYCIVPRVVPSTLHPFIVFGFESSKQLAVKLRQHQYPPIPTWPVKQYPALSSRTLDYSASQGDSFAILR